MEVPIKKSGNWIADTFDNHFKEAKRSFDLNKLFQDSKSETFLKNDLKEELEWLKQACVDIESPVTFTHVDFRGSNLMVTEPDDEIVVCDLEYSCYGFRGVDIGFLFYEWNREFADWLKYIEYPDDDTVRPFVRSYIDESVKLNGKEWSEDYRNSEKHILKEAKVFALVSIMVFITMSLKANENIIEIGRPFDKLEQMVFFIYLTNFSMVNIFILLFYRQLSTSSSNFIS